VVRSSPRGRAPPVTNAIGDAYSASAAAWQRGPSRVYDRLAALLVAAAPVSLTGRRVLDLGAGTGAATRAITGAGGEPIALDLAFGMLRGMAPARPPAAVADLRRLPLQARSVDGAVAAFSMNHVPDPHLALREVTRVLRPGSPLAVSAYATDDQHPVKGAVDAAAAELGWRPAPWVDELRASSIPVLATVEGARETAERAGLTGASVRHHEVPFPDLGPDDLVAWRCGMAQVAPFVARLDAAGRERLHGRARDLLGDAPPLVRRMVVLTAVI
jgi:SAM-dependent methyltransferase